MNPLDGVQPGDKLKTVTLPAVTRLDLIKYAGASGDYNPIHTIDEEAEKAGLPGVIAHGMWTMGSLAKLFTPFYEDGFIQDYSIRFQGMVFVGDVLTLHADVVSHEASTITFDVYARNQQEKDVIRGNVVFRKHLETSAT
ncbi:MaoC/PaaZ C-terminal domain-containing protein [Halobacillus litoralis]|uniref:MaoC/PaaZ C-terminal domain-containing protein n=1 Tax=Halobacillus litoralis TaxID=45668 RepID=UPI001CD35251|nr:MaoC/PaaZ C-terminal domain-containing protein [Halobacillus litoralis]MCA1021170.1 dehydratase [Halobacillus litoralis]